MTLQEKRCHHGRAWNERQKQNVFLKKPDSGPVILTAQSLHAFTYFLLSVDQLFNSVSKQKSIYYVHLITYLRN